MTRSGPLQGVRVVELAGIGPGPLCAMILSDLGADVVRVARPGPGGLGRGSLERGRPTLTVDLKTPQGIETLLRLADRADVLTEGMRPGVAERLGIGPEVCLARNTRLVYGRMTGWGQDGPLAQAAGHDINYISVAGVLSAIGPAGGPPSIPLNLIGDYGGGGMLLALGIACALVERASSGKGQVVDAAMVDGAALLAATFHGGRASPRGTGMLDGGAPFYNVYECSDGEYVAIGSIEPQFYAELLRLTGLEDAGLPAQMDRDGWPAVHKRLTEVFGTRTRDAWCEVMEGTDVCFAPVLSLDEAKTHPHNLARDAFTEVDGIKRPAPAPRFSRTPGAVRPTPASADAALAAWGVTQDELAN